MSRFKSKLWFKPVEIQLKQQTFLFAVNKAIEKKLKKYAINEINLQRKGGIFAIYYHFNDA